MRCTDLASRSCRDRPASVCADRPALVLGRRGDVRTRPVKRTPARHGGSRRMGSRGVGRRCPRDELIPGPVLVHCSRDPTPPQKAIRAPNPTAAGRPGTATSATKSTTGSRPTAPDDRRPKRLCAVESQTSLSRMLWARLSVPVTRYGCSLRDGPPKPTTRCLFTA